MLLVLAMRSVIYGRLPDSVRAKDPNHGSAIARRLSVSQKAIAVIGLIIAIASLTLQWQQIRLARQQLD
jgi:hypothetical protein